MRCRRLPIQSMFMGVVGRPRPDKNFDGHSFLEKISKTYRNYKKPPIRDLVTMFSSILKSKVESGDTFMFLI